MAHQFHFWVYPKELKAGSWKDIYLYTLVHSGSIHKSQKVESTKYPLINKCTKCTIYMQWNSSQKGMKSDACYNMTEPEDIMVSELNHLSKGIHCMIALAWSI